MRKTTATVGYIEQQLRYCYYLIFLGITEHFENILNFLPLPSEDWKNVPNKPNINSYVFVKSKDDIEGVVVNNSNEDDGDLIDFKKGTQIITQYCNVANLIKEGRICLI